MKDDCFAWFGWNSRVKKTDIATLLWGEMGGFEGRGCAALRFGLRLACSVARVWCNAI